MEVFVGTGVAVGSGVGVSVGTGVGVAVASGVVSAAVVTSSLVVGTSYPVPVFSLVFLRSQKKAKQKIPIMPAMAMAPTAMLSVNLPLGILLAGREDIFSSS